MKSLIEEQEKNALAYIDGINKRTLNAKNVGYDFVMSILDSPLDLKEGQSGNFKVERVIKIRGEKMIVVSMRNYIMMGYRPLEIILPRDRTLHMLLEGNALRMSDSPQELFLQYDAYKRARGKVLVGGLGLGMYPTMIAKKRNVKEIVIIEKEQDVINLAKPTHPKIRVIHDDIWNFVKTTNEIFDYAYIDIHYSTGAMEYLHTVKPMRKIFAERFPNMPVDFWGEIEMKSQVHGDPQGDVK